MASRLNRSISERIVEFVAGGISRQELQDWLAQILWDIEDAGDAEAESLAYGAELTLAEHAHGHLTDEELKDELKVLVPDYSALPRT